MKVSQLIELLEMEDPDLEVKFSYHKQDYIGTQVAASIDTVREALVQHSSYHEMDKVVSNEEMDVRNTRIILILE